MDGYMIMITEMSNRSKNDIVAAILTAANGGEVKTKIQARAYLSYTQLTRYLGELITTGALVQIEGQYLTTEKGRQVLSQLRQVDELLAIPIAA